MIFEDIKKLKSAIYSDLSNFKFPFERSDINNDFFNPPGNTFEMIIDGSEKILIPEENHYSYLYRGQEREYIPCLPTLYREKLDDVAIFIERMKLVEFCEMIKTHPVVKGFFNRHNIRVDYIGLAQHYGLKTEVLDLTSDLDVAIFFAICPYNRDTDTYGYHNDNKIHEGIIYVVLPYINEENRIKFLNNKITPIGMQPFMRPAMQRGFAYNLCSSDNIRGFVYHFQYTSEDSKSYYDKYKQGEQLLVKDELVEKAKIINNKQLFSYSIFKKTWELYKPKGFSKTKIKVVLKSRNILVSSTYLEESFSMQDKNDIIDEWNRSKGAEIASKIVRRGWFETDDDLIINKTGEKQYLNNKKKNYRTIEILQEEASLRIFIPDSLSTNGTPFNYSETITKKNSNIKYSSGWKKVSGKMMDCIGKPFLEKYDYMIRKQ